MYKYAPDLDQVFPIKAPPVALHDIATRRNNIPGVIDLFAAIPVSPGVHKTSFTTRTHDGHEMEMIWYYSPATTASAPGPALLQIHGGGMIAFNVHNFHPALNNLVADSGIPMLCVDYRLAPEHRDPIPREDCYTALVWLRDHAAELNVDATRIGITGDSAGGGLAAGVALMARDRGFSPPLAKQVLVYPMLDDRIVDYDADLLPFVTFSFEDKITSWTAYLGSEVVGTESVSAYAAPGRQGDLSGLPSTYIDVGQLDVFAVEDVDYARRLVAARVETEFHLYPGAPHAFDVFAPGAAVSKRAREGWIRAFQSF